MFSIKKLAGFGAGVVLLGAALAPVAQASALSSSQVSAILSLLQSFGADQSVINNVSSALGGSGGDQGGTLSCSSFSDVHYGDFDNAPGGRVSQLQTWLGIPSNTFGFGTYGKKTQGAWNVKCGGTQPNNEGPTLSIPGFGGQSYAAGDNFLFHAVYRNAKVGSWICASFTANDRDYFAFPSGQSECNKTPTTDGDMVIQGKISPSIPPGTYHLRTELYYSSTGQWGADGGQYPLTSAKSGSLVILPNTTVFSATPTSGAAPLAVQFTTNQKSGIFYYDTGSFLGSCLPDEAANGQCDSSIGPSGWTYTTPGTYTATLTTACPKNQPQCATTVLGTKTITVTGQTTGSVAFSVASTPVAQTLVAGTQGVTVANIQYDASGSSEDIRFIAGDYLYTDNMSADPNTCQAFDGSTALNTGSRVVNPSGTGVKNFAFDSGFTVNKGTVKIITIKCNIPSNATSGSFSWGLQGGNAAGGTGVTTGANIVPQFSTNVGNTMTVGSSLTVSTDPSSPTLQTVAGGTTGVVLGVYRFHAAGEAVQMRQIGLNVPFAISSDLTGATIYDASGKLISNAAFGAGVNNGATYFTSITGFNVLIPKDSDYVIILKGDIAPVGVGQPGKIGDLIQVSIDPANTYGTGVSSGATLRPTTSTSVTGVKISAAAPTVARLTPPTSTLMAGSNVELYRFSLTNQTTTQNLPLDQFMINLQVSPQSPTVGTVTVKNLKVYVYTDSAFSVPIAGGVGGILGLLNSPVNGDNAVKFASTLYARQGQTYYVRILADVDQTAGSGGTAGAIVTNLTDTIAPSGGLGAFTLYNTPTATTGAYYLFHNYDTGTNFTESRPSVTRDAALGYCQNTDAHNPWAVRCTWNGVEIFNDVATKTSMLTVSFDGVTNVTLPSTTLSNALNMCNASSKAGATSKRCVWAGEDIIPYTPSAVQTTNTQAAATQTSTTSSTPACTDATANRGKTGSFSCTCPKNVSTGAIWGGLVSGQQFTNIYTDDSDICTAAKQASKVDPSSSYYVNYSILPGQSSYVGMVANGITSLPYGAWKGSFTINSTLVN